MEDKVDFAYQLFEKPVAVDTVFQPNEMIDAIAITKGRGTEGVVTRWGVSRLPRKTHRGLRKARPCPPSALPRCSQPPLAHGAKSACLGHASRSYTQRSPFAAHSLLWRMACTALC